MNRFEKELTLSDVNQRLAVTRGMLEFLPQIDPAHDVPIRVLDETGKVYVFYLSGRQGRDKKPVFQAKHWKVFVKERGIAAGDVMYFWREENALTDRVPNCTAQTAFSVATYIPRSSRILQLTYFQ